MYMYTLHVLYMDTFLCVCMYNIVLVSFAYYFVVKDKSSQCFLYFFSAPSEVSVESVGSREGGSVGGASDGRGSSGRSRQIEKIVTFDNYEQYQLIMSEVREGGREGGEGGRR